MEKLGELKVVLMNIHWFLLKSEEFPYLCLSVLGKKLPNKASSNIAQLTSGAPSNLFFFHWSSHILATPFN